MRKTDAAAKARSAAPALDTAPAMNTTPALNTTASLRAAATALAVFLIFSAAAPALMLLGAALSGGLTRAGLPAMEDLFAYGSQEEGGGTVLREELCELILSAERTVEMWHYSGSYWNAIFDEGSERITDRELAGAGIDEYLNSEGRSLRYELDIPAEILEAIEGGGRISGMTLMPSGLPLKELFDAESINAFSADVGGETISFSLQPRFVLSPYLYKDFAEGYSRPYALISSERGWNLNSVFGRGVSAGKGWGRFDASDPGRITSPYIHPSMIKDRSGALKGGYSVSVDGARLSSDGLSIGSGTFAGGGAIGYLFRFPVKLKISYVKMTEVPAEQGTSEGGIGGPSQPPGPAVPTVPAIEEGSRISFVTAAMNAPDVCYVGHSFSVFDESIFEYGESVLSAERAYRSGLARGRISVLGGAASVKKAAPAESVLCFDSPGSYTLRLDVSAGSLSDSVTSPIEVRKVPYVNAVLGGTQKQNRRQTLQLVIAQDPRHPVRELSLELRDVLSGEKVSLKEVIGEGFREPENSENIKYRTMTDGGSDEQYLVLELEFLTKAEGERQFEYRAEARDSAGRTGNASASFTVIGDEAPNARIGLEERYYRGEGSNDAKLTIEDLSGSDGDALERRWYIDVQGTGEYLPAESLPGYRDLSLGSGQRVSVSKNGVGRFGVKLVIRDKWTEETLEEYVSEDDRLIAESEASSFVDNIAPVVSARMSRLPSAEILLIADDEENAERASALIPALKAALLERGISARISAERSAHAGEEEADRIVRFGTVSEFSQLGSGGARFSYQTMVSDFWGVSGGMDGRLMGSQAASAADAHRYYVMSSASCYCLTEGGGISSIERCYPMTLTAREISWEGGSLSESWRTTISRAQFDSPSALYDARFAHDEQEKYLYLISDGKTLLIEKSSGAVVGTLSGELGLANCVRDEYIYSVSGRGILRASLADGSVSLIRPLDIAAGEGCAQLVKGKLVFAAFGAEGSVLRTEFDPQTEALILSPLEDSESAEILGCAGVDTSGRIAVIYKDGSLRWWDADGVAGCIKASIRGSIRSYAPARDSSGRIMYVTAVSYRGRSGSSCYLNVYDLANSAFAFETSSSSSSEPYDPDRISYSAALPSAERLAFSSGSFYENEVWPGIGTTRPKAFTIDTGRLRAVSKDTLLLTNGISAGHSAGFVNGGLICMSTSLRSSVTHQLSGVSETQEAETARLIGKHLGGESEYSVCWRVTGAADPALLAARIASLGDTGGGASGALPPGIEPVMEMADLSGFAQEDSAQERVFAKGEFVSYDVSYSDFEGDPSKEGFWLYTHEPLNDGLHPQSGSVLSSPIRRFYHDGRYTLKHWQIDDAGRGLTEEYDKSSEPAVLSFIISGTAPGRPSIDDISTQPLRIKEGDGYDITVEISDPSGAALSLELVLRRNGEEIKRFSKTGITPDAAGAYPVQRFSGAPKAKPGTYEIEVKLRSAEAADIAGYSFVVVQERSVSGEVEHTEEWDANRRRYNLLRCGREGGAELSSFPSYRQQKLPRLRGSNVFWPGERLVVSAAIGGEPLTVSAELVGCGVSARLRSSGELDGDEKLIYTGTLWDSSLQSKLCADGAEERLVRFTAVYEDETLEYTAHIIFDDEEGGYWQIRREF